MNLQKDYFNKNLVLLKENHPQVWQTVKDYAAQPMGELQAAANGSPNLLVTLVSGEKIFMHDNSEPLSELTGYYNLVPEDAAGVVAFIGMGLGYTPPQMLVSRKNIRHFLIVEPEIGIFIQALHTLDHAALLSDKRVTIAIGHDIDVASLLAPMFKALQLESLYILQHLPCCRLDEELYHRLYDEIYKCGNSYNLEGNTVSAYGGKFIDNRLRHLTAIHHQQLLEQITDSFAGMPAIIVAGGPSLNKNIHLLSQAKGKAIIIAADTTLPALLAHGVTPDFTTSIDMQDITLEKIIDLGETAKDTSLICASWLSPLVPKIFPARQVYWTFTAKNMETWLNKMLGGKLLTSGAGTVAKLSFTAAVILGCSPIVFVGQDLSYPDRQDHVEHTVLTSKKNMQNFYNNEKDMLWVEGYGGDNKVPTGRGWLGDKRHFELCMESCKDIEFINATEGGVRLQGTMELSLQEVIERYCRQPVDVQSVIDNPAADQGIHRHRRMINEFSSLLKTVSNVEKDLAEVERLTGDINAYISKLRDGKNTQYHDSDNFPPHIQHQLQQLDACNMRLDKAKIWALLDEATLNGLRISERLMHEVNQLAEQPDHYLDWLEAALNRFITIGRFRRQVLSPFARQLRRLHKSLQRESSLLKKIAKHKGRKEKNLLDLLELYYQNDDYAILEKTIAAHWPTPSDSAILTFYLGAIAAQRCQFIEMNNYFAKVAELEPELTTQIEDCRQSLARRYLSFYQTWQANDNGVALRMLFKAVHYTSEPAALRQALSSALSQLITKAGNPAAKDEEDTFSLLAAWSRELVDNAELTAIFPPQDIAALQHLYGQALLALERSSEAVTALNKAIEFNPEEPELYLSLLNAYFAIGDYPAGIAALEKAVALDISYAAAWETIGDSLRANGQPQDAALAYEKCFKALPAEINLLQKIAACYQTTAS